MEEGAKAYLSRQIKTISVIAVIIFIIILTANQGICISKAAPTMNRSTRFAER